MLTIKPKMLKLCHTLLLLILFTTEAQAECNDRSSLAAALDASSSVLGGESVRPPVILKKHHPSKRKEVATYFKRGDLHYTLYFLVDSNCQARFIKRTRGKL